jgi:imidazolonepropionase-like amidohydrolase/Tol biopolymer transport system component
MKKGADLNFMLRLVPYVGLLAFAVCATPRVFGHFQLSPPIATQNAGEDNKPSKEGTGGLSLKPTRKVEYSTNEGTWVSLDVSRDGKTIAFDLVGHLYVVAVEGGRATAITSGLSFESQPRFSPDGKQMVYVSDRSGSNNLWISKADGSGSRQLTSDANAVFVSPTWTLDGRYVLTSRMKPNAYRSPLELWMYDVQGGSGLPVPEATTSENPVRKDDVGVVASPDGRYFYYEQRPTGSSESAKWQVARRDLRTGEEEVLTNDQGGGFRPLLSPDGTKLIYATHYDSNAALRFRDLSNGEERWLKHPVQRDSQESGGTDRDLLPGYAFTPDGGSIVIAFGGKIRKLDVKTGLDREIPFEATVSRELGPKLNFPSRVEEGPVEARLVQGAVESRDAKTIVFSALGHLYEVGRGPDRKPRRITSGDDREFEPAWSPDGKWLAFVTWSSADGGAVWKIAADGTGAATKLTRVVAYYRQPAWSADGTRVFALRAPRSMAVEQQDEWLRPIDGLELVSIPVDGSAATMLTSAAHYTYPHAAGAEGRIFVTELQKPNLQNVNYSLVSMRADGSDRRALLRVTGKNIWGSDFSPPAQIEVSPDGRRALALFRSQVYLFDLPTVGGAAPTLDLSSPAVAVKRLTDVGADFVSWADGGNTITWSLGSTYFRLPLTQADPGIPPSAGLASGKETEIPGNSAEAAGRLKPETLRISVQMPRATPQGTVVLRGAKVVTMRGDEVLNNADVVIHNERIQSVGPSGAMPIPGDVKVIDLRGSTIVPGFIDTHAHWFNIKRGVLDLQNWNFLASLSYGITAGRDPQTYTSDIFAYQDLVDSGQILGPRAYTTGPGIFSTNDFHSEGEAEKVISRYKDYYRTNLVKSYEVGDRRERQFVVEACEKLHVMPTTEGGAEMPLDLTHVIDGFGGNEHQFPIASLYSDVVRLVAQSGIYYTPTFIIGYYDGPGSENYYFETTGVYENPKLRRFIPRDILDAKTSGLEWFRKDKYSYPVGAASAWAISKAGGKVCVGSHGELQGLSFHWQLWSLQAGGMSNLEALRAGTLNGAEAIGLAQDLGTIEPGKLADLVILNKDPLEDIENTSDIKYVMKNGELFEGDTLNQVWPVQKPAGPFWWWTDHP